jgi:hypothetical protein
MARRKKSPSQLYWAVQVEKQIREEYEQYLEDEGKKDTSHIAHLFAMKVIAGGRDYKGMKERDLILFLAGKLPYMYD